MRRPLLLFVLPVLLLAGAAGSTLPASTAEAATAPYTVAPASPHGTAAVHEVTAVLIAPAGTRPDFTRDDAIATIQKAGAFWKQETNGFVDFQAVAVSDWVHPDDPNLLCSDKDAMITFAEQYAGWTPGANKHIVAFTPSEFQCGGYSNGEEPPTVNTGGATYVTDIAPAALTHELGHNLSLNHESSVQCTTGWDFDASNGLPASCTRDEYGNTTEIMGSAYSFYPVAAPTLDRLGLISHRVVPTCGAARRIVIHTLGAGFDAQRIISWKDPKLPSVTYYVQYRDAVDQSKYDGLWTSPFKVDRPSGVQILRTDPSYAIGGSILVRPGDSGTGKELVGRGGSVALAHGMSVHVVGMDESLHTATIDVTVPCS